MSSLPVESFLGSSTFFRDEEASLLKVLAWFLSNPHISNCLENLLDTPILSDERLPALVSSRKESFFLLPLNLNFFLSGRISWLNSFCQNWEKFPYKWFYRTFLLIFLETLWTHSCSSSPLAGNFFLDVCFYFLPHEISLIFYPSCLHFYYYTP